MCRELWFIIITAITRVLNTQEDNLYNNNPNVNYNLNNNNNDNNNNDNNNNVNISIKYIQSAQKSSNLKYKKTKKTEYLIYFHI